MTKKKIGELDGTPIVTGDKNYANEHEYYMTINGDNTYLKLEQRTNGDLFKTVLGGSGNGCDCDGAIEITYSPFALEPSYELTELEKQSISLAHPDLRGVSDTGYKLTPNLIPFMIIESTDDYESDNRKQMIYCYTLNNINIFTDQNENVILRIATYSRFNINHQETSLVLYLNEAGTVMAAENTGPK